MLQIKHFFLLVFGAILLTGCTSQDTPQYVPPAQGASSRDHSALEGIYQKVSPAEFNAKIESGEYTVLDVRTQEEYDEARITQDALNINFYAPDFEKQINALDKKEKYLLYCRSDNRSGKTLTLMENLQFVEAIELRGGISNWSASYPVVQ